MQKIVLALNDVHNELKCRKKVMKLVTSVTGIDSISLDVEKKKLTLIGTMDLLRVVSKLSKVYRTEVITVGPAKEPEKEKPKSDPEVVTPISYYPYRPCYPCYPTFYIYDY